MSPLLLLWLLMLQPAAAQTNINFAIVWDTEGTGAIAEKMFRRLFLPELNATCPMIPGVNETTFRFIEVTQTGLFDLALAERQLGNLSSSGSLFIGASSRQELQQFSTAGIPSGVPAFSAETIVHEIAPLPSALAAEGLRRVIASVVGAGAVVTKLAIVIGDGYELREFAEVVDGYAGNFFCFQLRPGANLQLLERIKETGATDLLLAAPSQAAEGFLEAAFQRLMLAPMYRWFFYNSRLVDKNDFSGFKVISKNMTSMEFGPVSTAIVNNLTLTREIYLYDLFSIWTIYLKKIVCKESGEVNQTLNGMTGAIRLLPNGSIVRQNWHMNFYSGLGSERKTSGHWSSDGTFEFTPPAVRNVTDQVLKNELARNVFKVVTVLKPPFVQYKSGMENSTAASMYDRLEGFAIDMCKEVLKNMSLENVEFFLQPDGQYGSRTADGEWNGVVGSLVKGSANLACLGLSDTEEREQVIQFTGPILSFQLSILYKKQVQNPLANMFQFVQPFHVYTWIGVVGSVLVLSVVLALLHLLSRNAVSFSLYDSIFFSFASLIQGITGTPPDRPSGQLVIAVYWLFAFVVLVAYVTNYAALRMLDRLQADITSTDSLLSQSAYSYGATNGSSYLDLFRNSTFVSRQQMYRHMAADPVARLPDNLSQAIDQVSGGRYAFIQDAPTNDYYAQTICEAVSVGKFDSDSIAFGAPLTAEYVPMVTRIVNLIIFNGKRDSLYQKYFTVPASLKPDCTSKDFPYLLRDYIPTEPRFFTTKPGALTLNNTLGIAVINLVGCVLTLLLAMIEFVFEKCSAWCKRRREAKERAMQEEAGSVDFTAALHESTA